MRNDHQVMPKSKSGPGLISAHIRPHSLTPIVTDPSQRPLASLKAGRPITVSKKEGKSELEKERERERERESGPTVEGRAKGQGREGASKK